MITLASCGAGLDPSSDLVLVSLQNPIRLSIPSSLSVSSAAFDWRKYSVPSFLVTNSPGLNCAGQAVKLGVPSPSVGLSNCTTLTVLAPAASAALEKA